MSVRVVARVRPLAKSERELDRIITISDADTAGMRPTILKIPNPKNAAESFSFAFSSIYSEHASQQDLFTEEVAPAIRHLFGGSDVTLFAYGATGTGKTHTMRGGRSLADRGIIPRLLSAIYRRSRKAERESEGAKAVHVMMSYYEIYNDKVFDLFEPQDKRTATGLPIRDNGGKTVVVGLSERPCSSLKDFEQLYDSANINRSTSATKLNAHSSRSHAVLCVKVTQTIGEQTVVSIASAIDLAGSEDNRRTGNDKERLVESSCINKSLFVLAQCVEALSKKQARIPYRESKMTRILSLGQNNGYTIMFLNLAPIKQYHLDTLTSLNMANRTKKIEIREAENEYKYKGVPVQLKFPSGREPLKPIPLNTINTVALADPNKDKPQRTFSVFTETNHQRLSQGVKRFSQEQEVRPTKMQRTGHPTNEAHGLGISKASIEEMVNRMVEEKLAGHLQNDLPPKRVPEASSEMGRRLEALEKRVQAQDESKSGGLQYLLVAKQHESSGDYATALETYEQALPFFPNNERLVRKLAVLRDKQAMKQPEESHNLSTKIYVRQDQPNSMQIQNVPSPQSARLLRVINSRDIKQIRSLRGVGVKKAESMLAALCGLGDDSDIHDLEQLGNLTGFSSKTIESMKTPGTG